MFRASVVLFFILITVVCRSQDDPFHEFTDKKGQKIRAALLDVSEDRRTMKIRREDGVEFESVINVLSLDDQQFLKDWLANRPENVDYRLEIAIARKPVDSETENYGSLQLETKSNNYEIKVRNLSRETLESARLEYFVIWEDGTTFYTTAEGILRYASTSPDDEGAPLVRIQGSERLESLAFNRETVVHTVPFDLESVAYSDGEVLYSDEAVGAVVRILTPSGIILAEARVGDARISDLSWDDAIALKEPEVAD